MSTKMDENDWAHTLAVFRACLPRRGRKAEDDRRFLEALHFFTVENVRWRALPERFGHWNSVWKRFDRLSKAGVFEAFFDTLASMSAMAHLIQMFNSTIVRAHVSAAGAKGGKKAKRSGARAAASPRRSMQNRTPQGTSAPRRHRASLWRPCKRGSARPSSTGSPGAVGPDRALPTLPGTSHRSFPFPHFDDRLASSRAMAKPCLDATLRPSPPITTHVPRL